jgi:ABC-2 type transport system permease protein
MRTWALLLRKEMLEYLRNYKWIWVPLVFLFLGVSNPVSNYYMPQILEAGGVAAEVARQLPVPDPAETMAKSLSQYGTLGLLVLALSFMGIVSAERRSGAAIMVLVKPVSHISYVMAKWVAMSAVTVTAFGIGHLGTWYYTGVLFDWVPFQAVWKSFGVYALWLIFLNTLTLLLSCLMKTEGGIAFLTLAAAAALSILTTWLDRMMVWSPSRLTGEAGQILLAGHGGEQMWLAIGVTAALIVVLLVGAVAASKRMWTKA